MISWVINNYSLYFLEAHSYTAAYMLNQYNPDSKVHGANMGAIWVLSAPDGPHDGPMNIAIRELIWR